MAADVSRLCLSIVSKNCWMRRARKGSSQSWPKVGWWSSSTLALLALKAKPISGLCSCGQLFEWDDADPVERAGRAVDRRKAIA